MNKLQQLIPIDRYWAIQEGYADLVRPILAGLSVEDALAAQKAYEASRADDDDDDWGQPAQGESSKGYTINSAGTALFNLTGPMTKKMTSMSYLLGGCSSVMLQRAINNAARDEDVKQAILYVDSPGGQVAGTAELADAVYKLAAKKPVLAYISDLGCSAAYWVAAQASAVWANSTALMPNMGVVLTVQDLSQMFANEGVKLHVIRFGEFKGAGSAGSEITPEQLAEWQREVDSVGSLFVKAVARGRGMDLASVKKLADGRVHVGAEAMKLGLCDAISSFEDAQKALESGKIGSARKTRAEAEGVILAEDLQDVSLDASQPTGMTFAEHSETVLTAVRGLKTRAEAIRDLRLSRNYSASLSQNAVGHLTVLRDEIEGLIAEAKPEDPEPVQDEPEAESREPSTRREENDLRHQHMKRASRLAALGVK